MAKLWRKLKWLVFFLGHDVEASVLVAEAINSLLTCD